jgi:predicted  nucleic acid-binding Zn-ribbon protein
MEVRSMNEALAALYALQQIDSALARANKKLQALDAGQAEQSAADSARATFDQISQTAHDTHGSLKDSELELQSVEKKQKDHESKLYGGMVQNPKELSAMQDEIEALGRQRSKLDERILTLMEDVEKRRAEEAQAKEVLDRAEAALAAKLTEYKSAARVLTKEIRAQTNQRSEAVKPIPAALLKRYDSFRAAKQGVAIGKLEDGRCGACHTNLPSNLIRRAETTESVELCENCGRMLFAE